MPPRAKKPASTTKASVSQTKPASKAKPKPASTKRPLDSDSDSDAAGSSTKKSKKDDSKIITVKKRGAAPVDPHSQYVDTHQVYESNDGQVWDAMLNQTDISGGTNSNKFYVIQLLHNGNDQCILFTRWGRVGETGATQTKGPWSAAEAVSQFKKQFKSKTATSWEDRHGMTAKKGKYMYLERDYNDEEEETEDSKTGENASPKVAESTLSKEIQAVCKLIFSSTYLDAVLSEMKYDAKKLPLGKLSKATILKGFAVLKRLAEVIEEKDQSKFNEAGGFHEVCASLCSEYYSVIPHDFGRNRPVVIKTQELLKHELEVLDNLGEMEIAQSIISSGTATDHEGNVINPIDSNFLSLGLSSMIPVAADSHEWNGLKEYVANTHGQTHHFRTNVEYAYRVEREAETKVFGELGYNQLAPGERLLLWHGSRSTNFAGILKQGLRIAPPEAPVTGYMFGKGVYLADMMSKSANYCHSQLRIITLLRLTGSAVVKPFHELYDADYNADQGCKNAGATATKGIGRTQPVDWQDAADAFNNPDLRGVYVPKGKCQNMSPPNAYLQYNEYIVYSTSQIRLRYLLMVKMQ